MTAPKTDNWRRNRQRRRRGAAGRPPTAASLNLADIAIPTQVRAATCRAHLRSEQDQERSQNPWLRSRKTRSSSTTSTTPSASPRLAAPDAASPRRRTARRPTAQRPQPRRARSRWGWRSSKPHEGAPERLDSRRTARACSSVGSDSFAAAARRRDEQARLEEALQAPSRRRTLGLGRRHRRVGRRDGRRRRRGEAVGPAAADGGAQIHRELRPSSPTSRSSTARRRLWWRARPTAASTHLRPAPRRARRDVGQPGGRVARSRR